MLDHLEPLLFSPSSFDLYRSTNYVGIWPCFDVRQDYLRTEFTPAPLQHLDTHTTSLLQRQTCSLSPGASSRCFFQQPIIRDPTSKKHFTLGTSFFFFPQRTNPTSTPCGDLLSDLSHQIYLFHNNQIHSATIQH